MIPLTPRYPASTATIGIPSALTTSTIVWTLKVQSSSQPITLTWTAIPGYAAFPVDASIILSGGGQTIDMRATDFAIYRMVHSTLTITLTRLAQPDEVWVAADRYSGIDGTYEGMEGGTALIYGYNAFSDIQDGVDAVGDSTVNVLEGHYSGFNVSDDDVQVIGRKEPSLISTPFANAVGVTTTARSAPTMS